MNFIYRIPKFEFNPYSEKSIESNWTEILDSIHHASTHLFQEIKGREFKDLPTKVKRRVFKYILRGRFRPTPFGLFAGVGLGEYGESNFKAISLDNVGFLFAQRNYFEKKETKYRLADCIFFNNKRIYFLGYILKESRWGLIDIPGTPLFRYLISNFKNKADFAYPDFCNLFLKPNKDEVLEIWVRLIELGLFNISEENTFPSGETKSVDLIYKSNLVLSETIHKDLEALMAFGGNLFLESESDYIGTFRNWFRLEFDDRSVPLDLLVQYPSFVSSEFLQGSFDPNQSKPSAKFDGNFWENEILDLKKFVFEKPISESVFDLQIVYRLGAQNQVIVENLVCNRPFVYHGRFNHDKRIREAQEEKMELIFGGKNALIAELRFFETAAANQICNTHPVCDYYISPFSSDDEQCLRIEDLILELKGSSFYLYHRSLNKEVIPIVTHPLNGNEISHPLMRLLWELTHQHTHKFLAYYHESFLDSKYVPQLNWGKLVLQTRRWRIKSSDFRSQEEFQKWLARFEIPHPILAGFVDRELVLRWKIGFEFEILWNELWKQKELVLSDPLWLKSSGIKSENGSLLFPQIIDHISRKKISDASEPYNNRIEYEASNCIYFWIHIGPYDDEKDLLCQILDVEIKRYLKEKKKSWHFLFYSNLGKGQIRLRFLGLSAIEKSEISKLFFSKLIGNTPKIERKPYYPEVSKYGREGISFSEHLFCMESEFLLSKDGKREQPLFWSLGKKIDFCVEFWTKIFERPEMDFMFDEFKSIVRGMDSKLKKELQHYQVEKSEEVKSKFWEKYYSWLAANPQFKSNESSRKVLLLNHLHMWINRFFIKEKGKNEELIYILIYRKLGKKIFSPKVKFAENRP